MTLWTNSLNSTFLTYKLTSISFIIFFKKRIKKTKYHIRLPWRLEICMKNSSTETSRKQSTHHSHFLFKIFNIIQYFPPPGVNLVAWMSVQNLKIRLKWIASPVKFYHPKWNYTSTMYLEGWVVYRTFFFHILNHIWQIWPILAG